MSIEQQRFTESEVSIFHPAYGIRQERHQLLLNFQKKLASGLRILDFGAGNMPYQNLFQFKEYKSADVAQNKFSNIDWLFKPENPVLPAQNNYFDLVLCMDSLEHSQNDLASLQEIHRVLKPGGQLVLSLPFLYPQHEMPYDYRRYTTTGIQHVLEQTGFQKVQIHKLGNSWTIAYNILFERNRDSKVQNHILWKLFAKFFNWTFLPILNLTLFQSRHKHEHCFQSMVVFCEK